MRPRDLTRYCRDLGWREALDLPEAPPSYVSPTATPCGDLDELARLIVRCRDCRLSEKRQKVVPGEGDPKARVMFIGEGPGAEEDRTGRPFVGQAGKLLDGMIFALGFERGQVFIGNVVKCRPPRNRDPQDDEMSSCAHFLERQIQLIAPQVIVALGRVAARRLTGTDRSMGALRGRWGAFAGTPLMATYHPAYLLRNPLAKREVWHDLKMVRKRLEDERNSEF